METTPDPYLPYNPSPILAKMEVGGYRFRERTWYKTKHLGTDWKARYQPFYAPTDGVVTQSFYAPQMGHQIHFLDSYGLLHRFGHLKNPAVKGTYKRGDLLGITGNTGLLTTRPHLHHDISKNGKLELHNLDNFFDPELFFRVKVI